MTIESVDRNLPTVAKKRIAVFDDADAAAVIAALTALSGGFATKAKAVDESYDTNNTPQSDDDLYFSIAANESWVARFSLNVGDGLDTTGLRLAVTTPSGATQSIRASLIGVGVSKQATSTTSGATIALLLASSGIDVAQAYVDLYVANGSTAGTVQLKWSPAFAPGGVAVTIKTGSFLQASRL